MSVHVSCASVKELKRWAKVQGVFMMSGGACQAVLRDLGDPVAIIIQRPVKIFRNSRGRIGAMFILNDFEYAIKSKKNKATPVLIEANYVPYANSFIYDLSQSELEIVLKHPTARYLTCDERDRVRNALRRAGEAA